MRKALTTQRCTLMAMVGLLLPACAQDPDTATGTDAASPDGGGGGGRDALTARADQGPIPDLPLGDARPPADVDGECQVDADCVARAHGRCSSSAFDDQKSCDCQYGCASDADCGAGPCRLGSDAERDWTDAVACSTPTDACASTSDCDGGDGRTDLRRFGVLGAAERRRLFACALEVVVAPCLEALLAAT